jgi:hypothetical protein
MRIATPTVRMQEKLPLCNRKVAIGCPGWLLSRHLPFDAKAFLVLLALSDESR